MLTAAGNINQAYKTLGVVHVVVTRPTKSAGCSGPSGLPVQEAFDAALRILQDSAAKSGGNGIIHISYDYRVSSTSMACNQNTPVFEVYGWGTVILLEAQTD